MISFGVPNLFFGLRSYNAECQKLLTIRAFFKPTPHSWERGFISDQHNPVESLCKFTRATGAGYSQIVANLSVNCPVSCWPSFMDSKIYDDLLLFNVVIARCIIAHLWLIAIHPND